MEKRLLQEMRFMMERLESPRMTDTELSKKRERMKYDLSTLTSSQIELYNKSEELGKGDEYLSGLEKSGNWGKERSVDPNKGRKLIENPGITIYEKGGKIYYTGDVNSEYTDTINKYFNQELDKNWDGTYEKHPTVINQ